MFASLVLVMRVFVVFRNESIRICTHSCVSSLQLKRLMHIVEGLFESILWKNSMGSFTVPNIPIR